MSYQAYFVSDIHLSSLENSRSQLFLKFLKNLNHTNNITHLFLLGDIFDMWLAKHDYFIKKYQAVVDELIRLKRKGVEIHYFEGNHDLYLKSYWQNELNFKVHTGPIYYELGERQIRLEHGDQVDPDDKGYLFLRWFLRTPPIKLLAYYLPSKIVAKIGEKASEHSRIYTSEVKTTTQDESIIKIRTYAKKTFNKKPFDLIVTGHLHVTDDYSFELNNKRPRSINLGTWLDEPKYLYITDQSCEIKNPLDELSSL